MEIVLNKLLSQINLQEEKLSSRGMVKADEAYQMTLFLNDMLLSIKAKVLDDSFENEQQEIDFFLSLIKVMLPYNIKNIIQLIFIRLPNFY